MNATFPRPLVALLLVALGSSASAQVLYVDDSAVGANDGSSWQDAFPDLQSALAVARPADVIWVARGRYEPASTLDRFASFTVPCAVYGGFDGTEASLADRAGLFDETILTGDLLGDDGPDFANYAENSLSIVTFPPIASPTLDGFTVRGGNANLAQSSTGGGLRVDHLTFKGIVRNCTFAANYAEQGGAGISCGGGATVQIERCTFVGNRTAGVGGGVYAGPSDSIRSCRFLGNSADFSGGGLFFGALAVDCLFSGNRAGDEGGGACATQTLANCTFSRNSAGLGGGMFGHLPSVPALLGNCVLWGNGDGTGILQSGQVAGSAVVDEGVVQGWDGSLPGAGTIGTNPLFRSPLGADGHAGTLDDDLRLELGSPCVDSAQASGYVGLGVDALGRPRFVDSLVCDGGGVLDRGAIERGEVDGTSVFCSSTSSSLGVPAEIGGPCTVSLSAGAFPITAQPVPDGRAFLLLADPGAPVPFGDGNLCLSGVLHWTAPAVPSGGVAAFLLDPSVPPASDVLLPGSTAGLQVLFRDDAAGGAGFNLSSAMGLLALP